jgi:type I restriction enzyme S subunit
MLARVDACKERLDRILRILKCFRQSILVAATSGHLTENWRAERAANMHIRLNSSTTTADSIAFYRDYSIAKLTLSKLLKEPLQNGRSVRDGNGAQVLRLTSIRGGKIDLQEKKKGLWSRDEAARFFVQEGDYLVARGNGSLQLVGRGGLVGKVTEEVAYPDTMIRIRPNTDLILAEFLRIIWNTQSVRDQIEQSAKTTAGIWKISQSDMENILLDVPTLEEQAEIVRRVEALFTLNDRLEARYRNACAQVERLTPALLAKAFRGELVPQDPNDEPASALLERIRADRAAQPVKTKRVMTSRKPAMIKMTKESVKEAIRQLPKDKFSFDELSEILTGDYDSLKDILFTLLSESEPILTQVFDHEERAMRFFRAGK